VLLDLGARPNQQPQHTRSGNTYDTAAGCPNRSARFLKPVRPLLLDLASHWQGKPVRPVWQTGQAGSVQKLPKTLLASRTSPPMDKNSHRTTWTSLLKKLFTTARRTKPVRSVWETGQTCFGLDSREELNPRRKLKPSTNRSLDSFHGSK
jgi:hypothetical protein